MRKVVLDRERQLAVVQIDFSAATERIYHSGLLFQLRIVGVSGIVSNVIAGFISGEIQMVRVVCELPMLGLFLVFLRVVCFVLWQLYCTRVIFR